MSFTDRRPFQVTDEFKKAVSHNGRKRFNCKLCGHDFVTGDTARWIFANFSESKVRCGNFFVCDKCDAKDEIVLECAKLGYAEAVKMAKRWDIYGPEWQDDCKPYFR